MIGWIILYGAGALISALIGSMMLFVPISDDDLEKRRGAKLIILSPVWPILAVTGVLFLWRKAKVTLAEGVSNG